MDSFIAHEGSFTVTFKRGFIVGREFLQLIFVISLLFTFILEVVNFVVGLDRRYSFYETPFEMAISELSHVNEHLGKETIGFNIMTLATSVWIFYKLHYNGNLIITGD